MAIGERDPQTGQMTTGHEWNGIKELNTRVPLAVWIFLIAAFIFSVGYWVLMPAWPLGNTYTKGLLGVDEREFVTERVEDAAQARARWTGRIAGMNYAAIQADPELMTFIRQDGHRLFGDNCAACHGLDATGGHGFPDLTDNVWLWGGGAEAVAHSIAVGVNSPASEQTRTSEMLAFGETGILDNASVFAAADYVKSLSDPAWTKRHAASIAKGREVFALNCTVCHGESGHGNQALGAPNLTDDIWLYGGSIEDIYTTIHGGRRGVMPAWQDSLKPLERKILTLYILDKGAAR